MTMLEAEFTRRIAARAQALGLLAHWCPDSRRCTGDRGFPDLFIAGQHGQLLAELKLEDGETSAGQDLWAWTLSQPGEGARYVLWAVPRDLDNGTVERELEALA